jgi:O-antigen ligase
MNPWQAPLPRLRSQPAPPWWLWVLLSLVVAAMAHRLGTTRFMLVLLGGTSTWAVLKDYRLGVAALTVLWPWCFSPLLPFGRAFNLINMLSALSLLGWALQQRPGWLRPPAHAGGLMATSSMQPWLVRLAWGMGLPMLWGLLLALPRLPDGAAHMPWAASDFETANFIIDRVFRPMLLPLWAFLLAQSLRSSRKPGLFLGVMALSALLPAALVLWRTGIQGMDISQRDALLRPLGLHANEAGFLLASAAAPLLAMAAGPGPGRLRMACLLALGGVCLGILGTGTRGAVMGLGVSTVAVILGMRRPMLLLPCALLVAGAALVLPDTFLQRLWLGLDDVQATNAWNRSDPLTQGRLSGWMLLWPEVLASPIWGQGLGSTAWSQAAAQGSFVYFHPHNLYLEILLDVGLLGLCLLGAFWWLHGRALSRASQRIHAHPPMHRHYLLGAWASLWGMAFMGLSNLHFMPCPEQTFIWFALAWVWAFEPAKTGRTP